MQKMQTEKAKKSCWILKLGCLRENIKAALHDFIICYCMFYIGYILILLAINSNMIKVYQLSCILSVFISFFLPPFQSVRLWFANLSFGTPPTRKWVGGWVRPRHQTGHTTTRHTGCWDEARHRTSGQISSNLSFPHLGGFQVRSFSSDRRTLRDKRKCDLFQKWWKK